MTEKPMTTPPRRRIAGLMGLVLLLTGGLAALRSASAWWAGAIRLLTVLALAPAALAAATRRGGPRHAAIGFPAFGWAYLVAFPYADARAPIFQPLLEHALLEWLGRTMPPGEDPYYRYLIAIPCSPCSAGWWARPRAASWPAATPGRQRPGPCPRSFIPEARTPLSLHPIDRPLDRAGDPARPGRVNADGGLGFEWSSSK